MLRRRAVGVEVIEGSLIGGFFGFGIGECWEKGGCILERGRSGRKKCRWEDVGVF